MIKIDKIYGASSISILWYPMTLIQFIQGQEIPITVPTPQFIQGTHMKYII